jgi:uncharacterized protein (DUF1697 family)
VVRGRGAGRPGPREVTVTRQVALLRGVNVGKGNRIAMAALRELLGGLGYTDVTTLLNSGNAVFSSPKDSAKEATARIGKALAAKLGIAVRVVVLTAAEMDLVIAENPLQKVAVNASRLLAAVWSVPSDRAKLLPLSKQDWGGEALGIGSRSAYLWCAEGIIVSELSKAVNKALGDSVTSRNWATVLKLQAMLAGDG